MSRQSARERADQKRARRGSSASPSPKPHGTSGSSSKPTHRDLPSRNKACPCGSGKLYKRCHGASKSPDRFLGVSEEIVGIIQNRQTGETRTYRRDLFARRITDEHPRQRHAFDSRFGADVMDISRELVLATSLVAIGLENTARSNDTEIFRRLGAIAGNAVNSVVSALELVRQGYGLQAGIVLRSVVEAVAVVLDVVVNEGSIETYRTRRYEIEGVAGRARRVFRIVGPLYGALSNYHTHVNESHEVEYPIDSTGPAATAALRMVKAATALVGLSVELLFQRSIAQPRYWKRRTDGSLTFAPDPDELAILRDFPRLSTDEASEEGVILAWAASKQE